MSRFYFEVLFCFLIPMGLYGRDVQACGSSRVADETLSRTPQISRISPTTGATQGLIPVEIWGANFFRGLTVQIGENPCEFPIIDHQNTRIRCKTRSLTEGVRKVIVINPGGKGAQFSPGFTFRAVFPQIVRIDPSHGPYQGGTPLIIYGKFLGGVSEVKVGGFPCLELYPEVGGEAITCKTTPGIATLAPVQVTLANGDTTILARGFTYDPPDPHNLMANREFTHFVRELKLKEATVSIPLSKFQEEYSEVLARLKELEPKLEIADGYRVNLNQIYEDPFLHLHPLDQVQIASDEVTDLEMSEISRQMVAAVKELSLKRLKELVGDFSTRNVTQDLNWVFFQANGYPSLSPRKKQELYFRFNRLFLHEKERQDSGERIDGTLPLALLALRLQLNAVERRCVDGIQKDLTYVEKDFLGRNLAPPIHGGDFISRVFLDHKLDYIDQHNDLIVGNTPPEDETRTSMIQVLKQKLHFPLHLAGDYIEVAYPRFRFTDLSIFQTVPFMVRFLTGESINLLYPRDDWEVQDISEKVFEAFNLNKMIELLQASRKRGLTQEGLGAFKTKFVYLEESGQRLTHKLLTTFSSQDEILRAAYLDFNDALILVEKPRKVSLGSHNRDSTVVGEEEEENQEEQSKMSPSEFSFRMDLSEARQIIQDNPYFSPPDPDLAISNVKVKPLFWIRLLEKYGYIIQVDRQAESH